MSFLCITFLFSLLGFLVLFRFRFPCLMNDGIICLFVCLFLASCFMSLLTTFMTSINEKKSAFFP